MKVHQIMSQPVVFVDPDTLLEDAARVTVEHRVGCTPAADRQGEVKGLLTAAQLGRRLRLLPGSEEARGLRRTRAEGAARTGLRRRPVLRDGAPVGMVSRHDLMKVMLRRD